MSSVYFESNSNLTVTDRDRRSSALADSSIAPLATPGLILGVVLLGLGLAALLRLGDWAGNYGSVLVVLAYVLYMAATARLVLWGGTTVWSLHRR
ncbi:hypothetical protein ACFO5K_10255 [Nocardia halotolerans]|uniref:Uncharacterized protein n=1 Tax=Nocardia halotolerans TaxID=1755878 RepID=A0ABV8VEQ2_9NOCA